MFLRPFLLFMSATFLLIAEPVRIMPVGDSLTFDWYYDDTRPDSLRHAYRNFLWYKLRNAGYAVDFVGSRQTGWSISPAFDPDNEGYTGYTSHQIASLIYNKLKQNPADIILLHIGTNDWSSSVDGVEDILKEIDRFEEDSGHQVTVILAQIINFSYRYEHVHEFNLNLKSMAENRIADGDRIILVNMETGAGIDYSTDFMPDGIHPNNTGYAKMATAWFEKLDTLLSSTHAAWLIPTVYPVLFE
jgi:lysophospholipase L1-like esterase